MRRGFDTVDLNRIRTVSLAKRKSFALVKNLATIPSRAGAEQFFDSLPASLKADDFKALIAAIVKARRKDKPVVIMAGGHLIKVGLNPIIIDLIKDGLITGLCLNGAGLIHDSEMAMIGRTSEDVAEGLADGSFGMAAQTAQVFQAITTCAERERIGLGQAAGLILNGSNVPFRRYSVLAACHRFKIPAMIHLAVDTDIVCQHPGYDPAAAARASHHDFTILAHILSRAEGGGVFINVGSAVILPEVFLKALTVSRNIHGKPQRIVTANFDMISHYRPAVNVVQRPTLSGGAGYNFVGHHELMIPLLAWGLKAFYHRSHRQRNNPKSKRR